MGFGKRYKWYFLGLFDKIEEVKKREFNRWCHGHGINVGCGLSELGGIGVDYSEVMLAQNPRKVKECADATKLPYGTNTLDYAFCSELLHHVSDSEAVVNEMKRVARRVVINEANIRNPIIFIFTRFLPFDRDAYFYDRKRFKRLLARHGGKMYERGFMGIPKVWFWGVIDGC